MLVADRRRVLLTLHAKARRWFQFGGHCEPGDATLAGGRAARGHRGVRASTGLGLDPVPVQLERARGAVLRPARRRPPPRRTLRRRRRRAAPSTRSATSRSTCAGGRSTRCRRARTPSSWRWSPARRSRGLSSTSSASSSSAGRRLELGRGGPAEQVALGLLGLRVAVDPRPERRRRGPARAGGRARGPARSRPPTPASPAAARRAGSSGRRACTSPSAAFWLSTQRTDVGRRQAAEVAVAEPPRPLAQVVVATGCRRFSDRSSRATIVSTHSASSLAGHRGGDQHHDPVAVAVGRDGAAAPLASGVPRPRAGSLMPAAT